MPESALEVGTVEAPGSKEGGHGDHWGCIFRAANETDLFDFIRDSLAGAGATEAFSNGVGSAFRSTGERIRVCVLAVHGRMVSAYPEVVGDHGSSGAWPITVREVIPWANGIEGQISGDCHGASVSLFDTRFYRNRHTYQIGQTYHFNMGALAYTLEPARQTEAESEELGAKISFKGACAYMPAASGGEMSSADADIDDYWFHSPLSGKISRAAIAGRTLSIYPVTIAIPEQFEMSLDLLAADHVIAPDLAERKPGDDLEGFLWLQGCLAPKS